MTTQTMDPTTEPRRWRHGLAGGLRRVATTLAGGEDDAEDEGEVPPSEFPVPALPTVDVPHGTTPAEYGREQLRRLLHETYPSVADRVWVLVDAGADAGTDAWLQVARLLYEAHVARAGGPSIEARQRALLATSSRALEAQARSSARLTGFHDSELGNPSPFEGDPPGARVWEHYLCAEARLARRALHGEAVGEWLGALGELWAAADALQRAVAAVPPPPADEDTGTQEARDPAAAGSETDVPAEECEPTLDDLRRRVQTALVCAEELSLW